ncbi:MAG TPA: hypothetical protein VHA56_20675 [Mucilaginibacter sp.]|nr:hypothetical protein [Mucilaginibacter sp.]
MTFFQFLLLDENKQTDAVLKGIYLDAREKDNNVVILHYLGGFYVEMYYSSDTNQIIKYRTFKSDKLLKPYLDADTTTRELDAFYRKKTFSLN